MALQDTLNDIARKAPAAKNRVEILLDRLLTESPEDYVTLQKALANPYVTGASLTRALRMEYGNEVVTDYAVDRWRTKHNSEVTGL